MLGPYIKSRGTRGTKMSENADLITVETLCTTRGNNLKTIFSFMGQNVKKNVYFGGILGALRGSSMIRLNLSCFPAIVSPISMYMWNKEAIFFKFTFLSLKPKIWKKIILFFIFGGSWGGLTSNPGERKFQGTKTS